ncbi:hypothetical protein P9436_11210 [Lysinibacillus capsici]|uniref:hypothetical protein n=1 Tax=Lysinibacillus capsici TaxID=2115968 RepID=UPI002E245D5F|nr:hypothetical protein [Lysinibacillus capsici]
MITAKVVNEFKEIQHNGHIYKPGDIYPAAPYLADEKRVNFLSVTHPMYKKIYLTDIQKVADISDYPKHTGGAWYSLSNGEKVKGKSEAFEAEAALKSGE